MNKNETYFDEFGRCIPEGLSNAVHQESRRYFLIKDVDINYSYIFNRIKKNLGSDVGITLEEFETRSKAILDGVNSDPQTKNITNGIITKKGRNDWLNGLEKLEKEGNYFFCVNRFLFSAFLNHNF